MDFTDIDTNDRRRWSIEQTRQQFAELALAGLRRRIYTGVFQRLGGSVTPMFICDLTLDGHRRNLIIRLNVDSVENGFQRTRLRYVASIQKLPPFLKSKSIELRRQKSGSGQAHPRGTLDLGAVQLVMTILPHRDVHGIDLWICVLEIVRSEG